jgi:rod shape-determining protein MreC
VLNRRTVVVCVLAALTLLTVDSQGNSVIGSLRSNVVDGVSPLTAATNGFFEPFQNAWNGLLHYGDLKDENEELRAELDEFRGRQATIDSEMARYSELHDLLELEWAPDLPTLTANVVGEPPSNFDQTVMIDKGTNAGIQVGMPVVTGAGLVGRIASVSGERASVRLVTDANFRAGVRLGVDPGIVKGQGLGRNPQIIQVQPDPKNPDKVEVGDTVVTNGRDESLLPKDIPIGEVISVEEGPGGLDLEIEVEPIVDLDRLDVVKVIGYTPSSG